MQNSAARIVVDSKSRFGSTQILQQLHWLPVSHRIDYKIALTVFKSFSTGQPSYLRQMLSVSRPIRSLRSSDYTLHTVPLCKTAIADRAFSSYAPRLWNRLPQKLRDCVSESTTTCVSIDTFKRMLKSVLFTAAFGTVTV